MTHEQRSELMELATKAFRFNYCLGYSDGAKYPHEFMSEFENQDPEFDFINFLYNAFEVEEDMKNDERSKK